MLQTWNLHNFRLNNWFCEGLWGLSVNAVFYSFLYITLVLVVYLGIKVLKLKVFHSKTLSLLYNIHMAIELSVKDIGDWMLDAVQQTQVKSG